MTPRQWIDGYFAERPEGRLIEIGAYDGRTASITAGLIARGWSAVQVEPNPGAFLRLLANQAGNPRVRLIHAAISARPQIAPLWADGGPDTPGQTSTIKARFARHIIAERGVRYTRRYAIATASAAELIRFIGGPRRWHFLLIDAEGLDGEILGALPLADMLETEVICAEGPRDQIERAAGPRYAFAHQDGRDVLLTRRWPGDR